MVKFHTSPIITSRYLDHDQFVGEHFKKTIKLDKRLQKQKDHIILPGIKNGISIKQMRIPLRRVLKVIALSTRIFFTEISERKKANTDYKELKNRVVKQIKEDIGKLSSSRTKKLHQDIEQFIQDEELNIPKRDREEIIQAAMATYASSRKNYGPIVMGWAQSLLETAKKENRKLVFLARDGQAPYLAAKKLQEKYPERYGDIDLSYIYFSRSLVGKKVGEGAPRHRLRQYVKQHGIENGDRCIFADIGFSGSMIDPVKEKLKHMNLDIEFEFLVSLNENAYGYLSDLHTPISSINEENRAGGNPASHWLEDTHQGVIESANTLEKKKDGTVQPNVLANNDPITCKDYDHMIYLLKHWGLQGVIDYTNRKNEDFLPHEEDRSWQQASEKTQRAFDKFLSSISNGDRFLLIDHEKSDHKKERAIERAERRRQRRQARQANPSNHIDVEEPSKLEETNWWDCDEMKIAHGGLYQAMKHLTTVLDEAGIRYWLAAGSLLGAMRADAIIPWDDDIDIQIHPDDQHKLEDPEIQRLLKGEHFYLSRCSIGYKFFIAKGETMIKDDEGKHMMAIDLFLSERKGDKITYFSEIPEGTHWGDEYKLKLERSSNKQVKFPARIWPKEYVAPEEVDELDEIEFGPLKVKVPKSEKARQTYLERVFGDNWYEVGYTPKYFHSKYFKERLPQKPITNMKIELKEKDHQPVQAIFDPALPYFEELNS